MLYEIIQYFNKVLNLFIYNTYIGRYHRQIKPSSYILMVNTKLWIIGHLYKVSKILLHYNQIPG